MNKEMKEALLIQCLDDLEAGTSVTEILARHPESVAEIQPVLTTARELMNLAQDPTPAAQNASHELFLAHAEAMRQVQHRPQPRVAWWRRLTVGFALVVLLLVGTVTAFDASAAALPGDALYPVKRTEETLQLMLTRNETTIATLRERFQKERVSEIKTLLQLGREADATCEGVVTAMDVQHWDVCDLQVLVNQNTAINGKAQVGSRVKVTGVTRSQAFVATIIQVIDPGNPPPTPTPMQTPPPTPTRTPWSTVTKTAVPPTITPTQIPPSPTATPTLEDDHPIDEVETEDDSVNEPGDDSLTPEPPEDNTGDDSVDNGSGSDDSVDDNSGSDTQDNIGDDSGGGEDNSSSDDAPDDGSSDDHHEDDSGSSDDGG